MPNEAILHRSRYELTQEDEDIQLDENEIDRLSREGRWGFVHSQETGSSVDGPGVRVVFWTTGCEFRCLYCHNPDTWKLKHGKLVCVDDLLTELQKYSKFLKLAGGGLTISGGEPLVQAPFVMNMMRGAKELGIHTCLDTNGFLGDRLSDEDLQLIDLVLLDIKSWDRETHMRVTAKPVEPVLAFARRLGELKRPTWLRFVLVPGLTDDPANIDGVAEFCATLGNIERVDVLPFHQLGKFKWEALGMKYELAKTATPDTDAVNFARGIFRRHGLNCPG